MEQETKHRGIENKFHFTGFVSEKEKWDYLSTFDVFGYPLSSYHYGSCDLALQESMAVGVVPVVLANPMESYMIKNRVTGITAKNQSEYSKALEELYLNQKLRKTLSRNTRKYALETFSIEKMMGEWNKVFYEMLKLPKTIKKWRTSKKTKTMTPENIFLESLGSYGKVFSSYFHPKSKKGKKKNTEKIKEMARCENWQSETKSTVHNFNNFLPGDKYLSDLSKLMKEVNKKKK
jgi:Glycosyltransferase